MTIIFIIAGLILLPILLFILYRVIITAQQNKKISRQQYERIKPLYDKLAGRQTIGLPDVLAFATDVMTRENTFQLLHHYKRAEIFPEEFYSIEKGAESNLANWLEFPTELNAAPDEIEYIKKVTIDFENQNVYYHVFQFRVNEPHWAAKNNWMLGIVGPYFDDSKPYDFPAATFSRLSKPEVISPDEEANWVHLNIAMRRG